MTTNARISARFDTRFFRKYTSRSFGQAAKSCNVAIRFTLSDTTSSDGMERRMETSVRSDPQQFKFLIAARLSCLVRPMTTSRVRIIPALTTTSNAINMVLLTLPKMSPLLPLSTFACGSSQSYRRCGYFLRALPSASRVSPLAILFGLRWIVL